MGSDGFPMSDPGTESLCVGIGCCVCISLAGFLADCYLAIEGLRHKLGKVGLPKQSDADRALGCDTGFALIGAPDGAAEKHAHLALDAQGRRLPFTMFRS